MAVTLKDVAERAGVSRSAVSRTFTEGASVSQKMRKRVEKAARELGYTPNIIASSLTTRRTKLIGLVSDNFRNPYFLQAFDFFTSGLQERGLRPMLVNLVGAQNPMKSVEMLKQYSVDGVIVASSTVPPEFVKLFREADIPVVYTFARYTGSTEVNVVGIDNVFAGGYAARILIERGYKRIGFIGGSETATSTKDRLEGFRSEVARHAGIEFSCDFAGDYSFAAGRQAMMRLMEEGSMEAYFGADDVISIGALSVVQSAGLQVPQDIGLLGLNDMEMAGWENINLTTIRQPIRQIVAASVELMAAMLAEPDRHPEARLFPCTLVERGTLRPPAK